MLLLGRNSCLHLAWLVLYQELKMTFNFTVISLNIIYIKNIFKFLYKFSMNKRTKFFLFASVLVGLTLFAGGVYAQTEESTSQRWPFVSLLAEKLDMDEEELNVVVEEVRQEHRSQMHQERSEKIQQAFQEGKLTERQLEILNAKEESRGMGRVKGAMLDQLNEQGLDVTHEEMQEIRDLMVELGVGGKMNGRGLQR